MGILIKIFLVGLLDEATELIDAITVDLIESVLKVEGFFGTVFSTGIIQDIYNFVYLFAIQLLILKFLYKGFNVYVLWRDGDPDCSPQDMLIGTCSAVAGMLCFPFLYDLLVDITVWFTFLITGFLNLNQTSKLSMVMSIFSGGGLLKTIILTIYLIMAIVLYVKLLGRGLELLVVRLAFPFGCLGLVDSDMGIFKNFTGVLFKSMATTVVQVMLLQMSFAMAFTGGFMQLILAIAAASSAFKIPTLMQNLLLPGVPGGNGLMKAYYSMQMLGNLRNIKLFK